MAGLEVGSDISVHAGPVETLEKALFCFVDAIMTDQHNSHAHRRVLQGQAKLVGK